MTWNICILMTCGVMVCMISEAIRVLLPEYVYCLYLCYGYAISSYSAKRLVSGEPNVAYICSRYYRAPELIYGAQVYTPAVDLWSAACVIAEMYLARPLFAGGNANDQLTEIIRVLGMLLIEGECL